MPLESASAALYETFAVENVLVPLLPLRPGPQNLFVVS